MQRNIRSWQYLLTREATDAEIHQTVNQLTPLKAARSDSMHALFSQKVAYSWLEYYSYGKILFKHGHVLKEITKHILH